MRPQIHNTMCKPRIHLHIQVFFVQQMPLEYYLLLHKFQGKKTDSHITNLSTGTVHIVFVCLNASL